MTPSTNPTYFPTAANSSCVYGPSGSYPCSTATPNLSAPIIAGWTDPNNNRYLGNVNTQQRTLVTFSGANGGWDYSTAFDWAVNKGVQKVDGGEANYSIIAPNGILSNLINPFGPQSAAGQSLINSAYTNGNLAVGTFTIYSLDGHASHPLGDLFDAGRPAQFAIGFDFRDEQMDYNPTPLATTLYTATYYPVEVIEGSRVDQAAYMELNVPVSKELEFTVSDRQDRYSDFGTTNNGKISFAYQPFNILKIRGSASTGFRAPSLVEKYAPQVLGATAGTMDGPGCAAGNYNTMFSESVCNSQGLGLSGGNPDLKPETSQNFDLGFIIEPIDRLGITLDYYRILVRNEIQEISDQTIYGGPTAFASDYVLNSSGTLTAAPEANIQCPTHTAPTCGYVIQTNQNTGGITTDGFDLSGNYSIDSDFGKFRFSLEGTFVTDYKMQTYTGGPELNLVGQFNGGFEPVIRWQHLLTVDWTRANWGVGLSNHFTEHYVDEYPDAAKNLITVGNYS